MDIQCMIRISSFSELPDNVEELNCSNNNLTSLPELPKGLTDLSCRGNKLTSLPELPAGLAYLFASENELTSLPKLPDNLIVLDCRHNKITSLPELPEYLSRLECYDNPLECLIPTKFIEFQSENWLKEYYFPFIRSYEGQKKILERDVTQITELILQLKEINKVSHPEIFLHPRIKEEFAYALNGSDLNLI